ncbi:Plant UBX domain-containing protein 8 [Zea mays]|uniref:Plant UBX domain-containing protein 8 n=1 Tax=Zea mays TaxID=4577 RepID=A0A1D6QJG0_MAIZE|nr:Plant UBX domain-containing protein 8 [Zea mays]
MTSCFFTQEHGHDLNEAVNAYFNEGDRTTTRINQNPVPATASYDDMMELDEPLDPMFNRPLFPRTLGNPFALLDPGFADITAGDIFGRGPRVTQPRDVRQIPIEVKDSNTQTGSSGQGPIIEDVTGRESFYGPEVHGTVIVDEDDEDLPLTLSAQDPKIPSSALHPNHFMPSAPPVVDVSDHNNDIEEEMIKAAIEASKREADGMKNTAERERALRQEGMYVADHSPDLSDKEGGQGGSGISERRGLTTGEVGTSEQTVDEENFQEDNEDGEEQPLVRTRSRRLRGRTIEPAETVQRADSPPSSPQPHVQIGHQRNVGFPSVEWGGISSEERDEALMLEAAMFGGIPEGAPYPFSFPAHGRSTHYPLVARPPSPSLTAQRLLREQQDDEYLAALQADREKELKAVQEAELRRVEEAAAREAALERQKKEEEEKLKKQREEEELESKLAAKQASLPKEPLQNDEGAVTVVVRMPDGSRRGRRFLKSDRLQYLFDFIDISRTFKPGTYRLQYLLIKDVQLESIAYYTGDMARSYPRRAFTELESQMSLSDLGLTSKQEALFLEKLSA